MARKFGIKSDPLAGAADSSVMEGILDRNRERGGRNAPTARSAALLSEESALEESAPPSTIDSNLSSYQDSNLSPELLIDLVTAASTARHRALVQLGVRIPAEQKDRLEEAQIRLRKKGITNQGIVIAALDAALARLEKEIEEL